MKHPHHKTAPASASLNRFQLEAVQAATQAAFASILQAVDPENVADLGGHFDPPEGNRAADAVLEAIAAVLLEAEKVKSEEENRNASIDEAAQAIAKAILHPAATDAETFEEVYHKAARLIQEDCQSIGDRDFARLIGGTVEGFGKDIQGVKPNRPFDA